MNQSQSYKQKLLQILCSWILFLVGIPCFSYKLSCCFLIGCKILLHLQEEGFDLNLQTWM